ncbi:hypothetical protein RJ641_012231 [Dillenia turbinata]|uniref:Uncharacterized protein n=1 Tax=Dillenia turbinata TaxID=194707 RepID=A0AAN8UYT3_9MAGN
MFSFNLKLKLCRKLLRGGKKGVWIKLPINMESNCIITSKNAKQEKHKVVAPCDCPRRFKSPLIFQLYHSCLGVLVSLMWNLYLPQNNLKDKQEFSPSLTKRNQEITPHMRNYKRTLLRSNNSIEFSMIVCVIALTIPGISMKPIIIIAQEVNLFGNLPICAYFQLPQAVCRLLCPSTYLVPRIQSIDSSASKIPWALSSLKDRTQLGSPQQSPYHHQVSHQCT